jgi:site-specific recombinase XerD
MRLLHAGVDPVVIALWLGHERIETTNVYVNPQELHQTRAKALVAC